MKKFSILLFSFVLWSCEISPDVDSITLVDSVSGSNMRTGSNDKKGYGGDCELAFDGKTTVQKCDTEFYEATFCQDNPGVITWAMALLNYAPTKQEMADKIFECINFSNCTNLYLEESGSTDVYVNFSCNMLAGDYMLYARCANCTLEEARIKIITVNP